MRRTLAALALGSTALALAGCELGSKEATQGGYRGTGMAQIDLINVDAAQEVPAPPYDLPAPSGVKASEVYQNVPVLGDMDREEFDYLMAAITEWVSPEQGCNYCHNPANLAEDSVYTKVVARRMLQMNRSINVQWANHVQDTGVTCWTCHRGNPVPDAIWTLPAEVNGTTIVGNRRGQNAPRPITGYASLPTESLAYFFSSDLGEPVNINVNSSTMHPNRQNRKTTMEAEQTYALMMHLSTALGVNCTHCHNTQNFAAWNLSTQQRATSWYGIRMVRDINDDYISPLHDVFPANRLGPRGDPFKASCVTCHQGNAKPMGGVQMVADYPWLQGSGRGQVPASPSSDEVREMLQDPAIVPKPVPGPEIAARSTTTVRR